MSGTREFARLGCSLFLDDLTRKIPETLPKVSCLLLFDPAVQDRADFLLFFSLGRVFFDLRGLR